MLPGNKQLSEPILTPDLFTVWRPSLGYHIDGLSHWGLNKMAYILPTTFSNACCCNFYILLQISQSWGSSQQHISTGLTHWGRVTHICVGKLTIIDSDNGLSPGRRQAIIWTNAVIFLMEPLGTNFNEILIGIQTFSFKKMHLKMASAKWRPFCLGLYVLNIGLP